MRLNYLPGVSWIPVEIPPGLDCGSLDWLPSGEEECAGRLAGSLGTWSRRRRHCNGLTLVREEFHPENGEWEAHRICLKNNSGTPVSIDTLTVLALNGNPDSLHYHCAKRLKNEKPYSAIYHGEEVAADPILLFRNRNFQLLFGWLDGHRHPAMLRMTENPEKTSFANEKRFSAVAEYHGQCLPDGEELATQLLVVRYGNDYHELLQAHAEQIRRVYSIAAPSREPPFVISTWHYFGTFIDEKTVARELDAIRDRNIPCDVYQLDAGYYRDIGDWLEPNEHFPNGLRPVADRISAHGFSPGVWLSPFMISVESETAKQHPEWFLKTESGERIPYRISRPCAVLDLSRPEVLNWIEAVFRKFREFGFRYFKADFTRCMFTDEAHARPHDRRINLLAAYRLGIEAIRRGIGAESFLNVCGGHSGGIIGLADSQRTGHDTYGRWQEDDPTPAWHRIRQGMFRSWMGAWRYNDPDAAVIRLGNRILGPGEHGRLALGDLTDSEAEIMVLHQFIAGGVPALGESIAELQQERLDMMRRVVPSPRIPARLLDPFNPVCPSRFATRIKPENGILPFMILSAVNVEETVMRWIFRLTPDVVPAPARKYLVFDLSAGTEIGWFAPEEECRVPDLPPHSCRVLAVSAEPETRNAFPAGGDGHYALAELAEFSSSGRAFRGRTASRWGLPLKMTFALPIGTDDWETETVQLEPNGIFERTV